MYTQQSAFDIVVRHLRKQGHRAVKNGSGTCLYRANDGSKCAIGALIPDSEYTPGLEGNTADQLGLPALKGLAAAFLYDLQQVHDTWYPEIPKYDADGNPIRETFRVYDMAKLEVLIHDFAKQYNLTVPRCI